MSDLRNKYKPVDAGVFKKKVNEEEAMSSQGKGMFLQLNDGKNRLRFFPPHDPKSNFYVMRGFYWVKNYSDDDSGDELYNRTVLSAKIHGGAKLDLIEEYVKSAKEFIENDTTLEASERASKLELFSNWKTGIQLSRAWVAYVIRIAGENRNFGLIELNKTLRDKINAEVMLEDDDEPITVDPFTDLDEGKIVTVFFNKSESKAEKRYTIKIGKPEAITDEELEIFDKAKPLGELFTYSSRDWEAGLEGIKIFDDANDINLFSDPDWLERIEEIASQFRFARNNTPEEEAPKAKSASKQPAKAAPATKSAAPAAKKAPAVADDDDDEDEEDAPPPPPKVKKKPVDEFEGMDRESLKEWIAEQHEADEESVAVLRVKKSMSDEDIRVMIREWVARPKNDADDEDEEDEEETAPPPAKKVPPVEKKAGATPLEEMRAKLAALKK